MLQRRVFRTLLEKLDLKDDREGRPKTFYSLRHTYISFRLLEGANVLQLAWNCRTSVEMIEKYYVSHIKSPLDASAINIRRGVTSQTGNSTSAHDKPEPAEDGATVDDRPNDLPQRKLAL